MQTRRTTMPMSMPMMMPMRVTMAMAMLQHRARGLGIQKEMRI